MYEKDLETEYKLHPFKSTIQLNRYMFISRFLDKDDVVIDIGCGNGYAGNLYATIAKLVYGFDITIPNHNFNKKNLIFLKANVKNIKFSEYSPNVIIMNDFIEHLRLQEGEQLIKKCYNVLKPYGLIIIGTPNVNSYSYRSEKSKMAHIHEYIPSEIINICKKYFNRVLSFSMNNEFVNVGKDDMSWFTFVIGVK